MKKGVIVIHPNSWGHANFDVFIKSRFLLRYYKWKFRDWGYGPHEGCPFAQDFKKRYPEYHHLFSEDLDHLDEWNFGVASFLESLKFDYVIYYSKGPFYLSPEERIRRIMTVIAEERPIYWWER